MPSKSKEAHRRYQKTHYNKNKQYYKDKRAKRRNALIQQFVEFKKTLDCCLCDENHVAALDFHHFDPNVKEALVQKLANHGNSWSRIVAEIEKCACLCANCHRKVHADKKWTAKVGQENLIVVPEEFQ